MPTSSVCSPAGSIVRERFGRQLKELDLHIISDVLGTDRGYKVSPTPVAELNRYPTRFDIGEPFS